MGTGPCGELGFCIGRGEGACARTTGNHNNRKIRARTGLMQKESYLSDVSVTSQTHPGSHKGTMPPTFDLQDWRASVIQQRRKASGHSSLMNARSPFFSAGSRLRANPEDQMWVASYPCGFQGASDLSRRHRTSTIPSA